ncbi:MAG: CTP-dependent riboflavin kinase [Theionarchaea archaeon]|nr:CTP-dependent riboflavin kinase [Theionarchaea archaeon]
MLEILMELARLNGPKGITITTNQIGQILGCSQQTASRKLIDLEEKGLIKRQRTIKGQKIRLTKKGVSLLREYYIQLRGIFEEREAVTVKGQLVSGMGEGHYYISRKGYTDQFEDNLGFRPFPGTLNLLLEREHDLVVREMLDNCPYVRIEGFEDEGRTFGDVKCYPISIQGVQGAILSPLRTHHPKNVIEIIAPVYLRKELGLNDGDDVIVKVFV